MPLNKKSPHPLKRFVFTFLKGLAFFILKKGKPDFNKPINNILIVNLGLIGDVLMITPLIRSIRHSFPESKIFVLVPPWSSAVLSFNPNIDELIAYNTFWADSEHSHKLKMEHIFETIKLFYNLRKVRFDVIINTWFADQPLTALLIRFFRSKFIIGFDFPYTKNFYDKFLPFHKDEHIVTNLLSINEWLVDRTTRSNETKYDLDFYLPLSENIKNKDFNKLNGKKYLVISPFSSEKSKQWKIEKWVLLINYLKVNFNDLEIVVTGINKFLEQGIELEQQCKYSLINLVGKQNIYQFAYLLSKASLVITVDSGTLHIAGAFNVPIFVLYSRQYNFKQLLPIGTKYNISVIDVPCAECIYGCNNPICMDHSPEDVSQKICEMLEVRVNHIS